MNSRLRALRAIVEGTKEAHSRIAVIRHGSDCALGIQRRIQSTAELVEVFKLEVGQRDICKK